MDNFMARPTDVLVSFMAHRREMPENMIREMLPLGRLSMALEIITVMRLLEEHQLMAEHEAMVACLQTLLVDQDYGELAHEWYEHLAEWRRIKLVPGESDSERDASIVAPDVQPSEHAVPPDAPPPPDSTDAPPGSDQTTDLPSGE